MSTAALFAHPGHELRALGWCMRHKPKVFFVTNGQGSRERGRLETSLRILKEIGCDASPLSGCFSDGEIYEAMLANRPQKIAEFFRSVQRELDGGMFQQLIFDRVEGFNPTHDLVALLGRELAQVMARGRPKTEFSVCGISLEASPEDDERHPATVEICRCTDEEVTVKLRLAESYVELTREVKSAIQQAGEEAFRTEWGWRLGGVTTLEEWVPSQPTYERHGEERVRQGVYKRVLRRDEHVIPFFRDLLRNLELSR